MVAEYFVSTPLCQCAASNNQVDPVATAVSLNVCVVLSRNMHWDAEFSVNPFSFNIQAAHIGMVAS